MWRYRLKVGLLALGVVLGYGSALHHHGYGHGPLMRHLHGDSCSWPFHEGHAPANAPTQDPGKPLH